MPLLVDFAKIPSAVLPSTIPLTEIVKLPAPAFSALIPPAEPVTAFAVIVMAVPLAEVVFANIPCLLACFPSTAPFALMSIVPVLVLPA